MKFKLTPFIALASVVTVGSGIAVAQHTMDPMVGGHTMSMSKNIVQNAMNSNDHTTLVAAVKAAGLAPTLEGKGPFTVFAPTNEAFNALPKGTVPMLLKPAHKAMLVKVLKYHVVPGTITKAQLESKIKAGGGTARLKTVQGEYLKFRMHGEGIEVIDAKGNIAHITIYDVRQSNGNIFVVNRVLMPN